MMDKEKALQKLASLCTRSEQCEYELIKKMIRWQIPSGERTAIMDYLRDNRFVDNGRFAKSFASDKARFSAWGPVKIKIELLRRQIKSNLISKALQDVDPKIWKEGLLKNAVSKSKSLDLTGEDGFRDSQKLYKYLISRGFSSGSAIKAVAYIKKLQSSEE